MEDVILEQDASSLLVHAGRTVELWILDNAKRNVQGRAIVDTEPPRIQVADIRKSLEQFMDHGVAVLNEIRDETSVSSRRAG